MRFIRFAFDENINKEEEKKKLIEFLNMQNVPSNLLKEIKEIKFVESESNIYFDLQLFINGDYDGSSIYYIQRPYTAYRNENEYIGGRWRTVREPYTDVYNEPNSEIARGNIQHTLKKAFIYPYNFSFFKEMLEINKSNYDIKEVKDVKEVDNLKELCNKICNSDSFIKQIKEVVNAKTKVWLDKNINEFSGSYGFDIVDYEGDVIMFPTISMIYQYKEKEYKSHFAYVNGKVYRFHESYPNVVDYNLFEIDNNIITENEEKKETIINLKKEIENIEKKMVETQTNIYKIKGHLGYMFSKKDKEDELKLKSDFQSYESEKDSKLNQIKLLEIQVDENDKKIIELQKEFYNKEKKKNLEIFLDNNSYIFSEKKVKSFVDIDTDSKKVQNCIKELDELIGLNKVKDEVKSLINLINLNIKREKKGLSSTPLSYHLVFAGNPGTGKTTVARLLAKIYKSLGIIEKDEIIEVDRSGLVAGYVGQTAIKTSEVINKAMGGILFIDEAYSLEKGDNNDFGQEAIDTILKAMEDNREKLVVIVAGYTDLMQNFINSNPGLKSRFNRYIDFEDYTPEDLVKILLSYCKKEGYKLSDEAVNYAKKYFEERYKNRDENYANARDVRNFFEKMIINFSNRLASKIDDELSKEELVTIKLEDMKNIIIK